MSIQRYVLTYSVVYTFFHLGKMLHRASLWFTSKKFTCQCRRHWFDPWVRKVLWRRKWQPTPVVLPGKSHGQRSLVGYSPWGHKRVGHDLETKQQQQKCYISIPAAAAKSLQSCPTLCNPIDGSPRGSPVPGILQARTLEWVAISFSSA